MQTFIRKITSRKLWAAIAGIAVGIATIFGVDEGTISVVAGAVTALFSVVAYIFAEGKIDAAHVAAVGLTKEDEPKETADEAAEMEDGDVC